MFTGATIGDVAAGSSLSTLVEETEYERQKHDSIATPLTSTAEQSPKRNQTALAPTASLSEEEEDNESEEGPGL